MWIKFLTASLVFVAIPSFASGSGPQVTFDKETHDYGKVRAGQTVSEEFTLSNRGDATLVIKGLRQSCGCTKAVIGSREVPPQSETKIVASFDTTGQRAGRRGKVIYVDSNDPERPTVTLTLLADIVRDLSLEPPSLAKDLPSYSERVSFPVRVSNSSDKPYAITGVKTDSPGVIPMVTPASQIIPPGETVAFTVEMTLEKDSTRYFYAGRISLLTDHVIEPELDLRYLITLKSGR